MAKMERERRFAMIVSMALCVAPFSACSHPFGHGTARRRSAACHFTLSIRENWSCTDSRKATITSLIVNSRFTLLTISPRKKRVYKVIEPTRHVRGTVSYDTARLVSGSRGRYALVPFTDERGRKYVLVWAIHGEFDKYRGVFRDLPRPSAEATAPLKSTIDIGSNLLYPAF